MFGRGAHGSMPQSSIDPVVMAAATVLRLQTIVSREVAPTDAAVVTAVMIQANPPSALEVDAVHGEAVSGTMCAFSSAVNYSWTRECVIKLRGFDSVVELDGAPP